MPWRKSGISSLTLTEIKISELNVDVWQVLILVHIILVKMDVCIVTPILARKLFQTIIPNMILSLRYCLDL